MNSSRAVFSVMPKPPAAFSALITTKSSFRSRFSAGRWSERPSRPDLPTTSPKNASLIRSASWDGSIARLGQNAMQADVVRFERQIFELLPGIGEADASGVGQGREGSVVVAAALPQPRAVG